MSEHEMTIGERAILLFLAAMITAVMVGALAGCTCIKYPLADGRSAYYVSVLQKKSLSLKEPGIELEYNTQADPVVEAAVKAAIGAAKP